VIDSWHYPYNLAADSVTWSMEIVPGRTCFAGVRFGDVVIERVKLVSPPQSGQIALRGPGFSYTAKQDFAGEDSFTLEVSGTINKRRGNSTIHITVSDRALGAVAPPPVEYPPAIVPIPQAPAQSTTSKNRESAAGTALPPCAVWDWSKGTPPPMQQPFDRSKLVCPPPPFRPPNPPIGCVCPNH
jgi:hypothetical protein